MDALTVKREKSRLERERKKEKKMINKKKNMVVMRKQRIIKAQIENKNKDSSDPTLNLEFREVNTLNCWAGTMVFDGDLQQYGEGGVWLYMYGNVKCTLCSRNCQGQGLNAAGGNASR